MIVLSFFNHAGGAGKTSTARDVGYVLGKRDFRVLMIDADAQANLTEFMGIDSSDLRPEETTYAAVMDDSLHQYRFPTPRMAHGVAIIPSHLDLARADRTLAQEVGGYQRLQRAVQDLTDYDFVIIDCPPNLGTMSVAALAASEYVVIPVQLRKKFRDGLWTVVKIVKEARSINSKLAPLIIVPTQTDTTIVSRENLEYLHKAFGPTIPVSSSIGRRPAVYGEAEEAGAPVPLFQPNNEAAKEVEMVTNDILRCLGAQG